MKYSAKANPKRTVQSDPSLSFESSKSDIEIMSNDGLRNTELPNKTIK